ncbi:hypothetical protein CVT26_008945 [Gymnopilus dilepis]|uniref:REJ domain-containing protein n=1 Tax=Gymnopilus dilepis TaxID=231916 RepID=A0A409YRR4_9AGAR|nr:hypothetical protein CVT26_008945 [Gymnopilus dilepis]
MPRSPLRLWSNLLSIGYFFLNRLLIVNASSSGSASSTVLNSSAREPSSSPISATPATKSSGLDDQVPAASEPTGPQILSSTSVVSASVPPSTSESKAGASPSTSSAPKAASMSTSRPSPSPPPKTDSSVKDTPVLPPTSTNSSKPSTETSSKPASSTPHANPSSVSTKGNTASVTRPGPPSTRPVQSGQAPPTSSHTTSTTTSVVVVTPTTSARTSTVTTQADTTFSKPLALTTTGPNGSEVVTTPPLVTIISTSTAPDGGVATLTHVVANPNFNSSQQLVAATGIHKPGVLAGVCIVAGVVLASLLVGLVFCFRRHQRIRRRRQWLAGMQQQRPFSPPNDPFIDPPHTSYQPTGPEMRTVNTTQDDLGWNGSNNSHSSPIPHEPMTHEGRNVYSLYPDPYPLYNPAQSAPSRGTAFQGVGPAYTADLAIPAAPFKRHSLTPSSPSIYPVTLPPDEDDHHEAEENTSSQEPVSPKPPPRPPRSHLRESAKFREYEPLTPPDSVSASSLPPSPISESRPQDILSRRTLLDIRTRPIA